MRAMVITDFGGPEVLVERDMPKPQPGPGQVLVRVHATSVNPIDYKIRQRGPASGMVPPIILGYDVSGVVVQVGESVQRLSIGDEVYYSPEVTDRGSYAEYHLANAEIVVLKPPSLSHFEAASIPLAACTAWDALVERAKLRVAESILIHGIGGVGSMAVQIAKACGAFVFASGSDYMLDLARDLGADKVIDYKTQDFGEIVLNETLGAGVDVVFDTVGGDLLTQSIGVVKPFGRMVGIVSTDAGQKAGFAKNITTHMVYMQRARYKLDALRALVEWGHLRPVVDSVLPLADLPMAHQRLEAGGVKGKIVLNVGS